MKMERLTRSMGDTEVWKKCSVHTRSWQTVGPVAAAQLEAALQDRANGHRDSDSLSRNVRVILVGFSRCY